MADKLCTLYNPNDDTQIYPFCRLKLVIEHLMNEPIKIYQKVTKVKTANKKMSL